MSEMNLNTWQQDLEQLLCLLQKEQQVLITHPLDGSTLLNLAESKREIYASLEQSKAFPDQQQQLHDLAQQVRHLNQVNGDLIQRQMIHNQKALNTLAELSGRNTYGADGLARNQGRGLTTSA